jgi:hypothetical protein
MLKEEPENQPSCEIPDMFVRKFNKRIISRGFTAKSHCRLMATQNPTWQNILNYFSPDV